VAPSYLSVVMSAMVLIMVILGGPGTLFGPALGAIIIVFLENAVSAYTERWLMILGAVYVLATLFAPYGLLGKRWRAKGGPS
jgi:branched-chain amino acid transport system permease protein